MSLLYELSFSLEKLSGITNLLTALSTLAAVVVSLRLAHVSHRPRLQALAYIGTILHPTGEVGKYSKSDSHRNIAVSLQNIGPVAITLNFSSFSWKFRWFDIAFMQNPLNPDLRIQNLVIPPAEGKLVILSNQLDALRDGLLEKNLWLPSWRLYLEINGTDGRLYRAKLSKGLRKELTSRPSKEHK